MVANLSSRSRIGFCCNTTRLRTFNIGAARLRGRCAPRMALQHSDVHLLVVSGKDAPELDVLSKLPQNVKIHGPGRNLSEFESVSEEDWDSIQVLLNCGVLQNAAKKDVVQALFAKAKNLKWMHSGSAGVEHIMFPELVTSNVILTNAKGVYSHSLAEYALTACNWFAKDLPRHRASQKAQKWDQFAVEELRGTTMGIIGLGDIGFSTGKLAKAFKMRVVGLRRNTTIKAEEESIIDKIYPPEQLCDLMKECDYVVASLPFTPQTHKFISREAFQSMKPHGVFINIGRGKTIDEDALIEVLEGKKIRGAALDVFTTEPLPPDSPFYKLDSVLMTAHCADRTKHFQFDSLQFFVDLMDRYLKGQEFPFVVNKNAGY